MNSLSRDRARNPRTQRRGSTSPLLRGSATRRPVGFGIALYLTLFQLNAFYEVWDPFFDSRTVLELTEPVPDAFAGALWIAMGAFGLFAMTRLGRRAHLRARSGHPLRGARGLGLHQRQ